MKRKPDIWKFPEPDTEVYFQLLENPKSRPTILFFHDRLQEAMWECQRIQEEGEQKVAALQKRVQELEARFIQDSHNSSKPPSSDGLKKPKRTRSLRLKSGKAQGGQPGHIGSRLQPDSHPDIISVIRLHKCRRCGKDLAPVKLLQHEVRQVIDIKDGRRFVAEYRAEMKLCPQCGSMNHSGFPPEAQSYVCYGPQIRRIALYLSAYQFIPVARVRQIIVHLYGIQISTGNLHRWSVEASKKLKTWENEIKRTLIHASVAHFDETGCRSQGTLYWLHSASTETETLFSIHSNRGTPAMKDIGILPDFKGIAVHDGLPSYFQFDQAGHSLCNVHHLRELTYIHELEDERWAFEMKALLKHALHHLHRNQAQAKNLKPRWIRSIERKYDRILKKGYRAYRRSMPKHPPPPKTGLHEKRDPGHALLRRLHFYKNETLLFLRNTEVPFSNNRAERDIRMAKLKQKISGGFRSFGGAKAFCRIRSFFSTQIKRGHDPFEALLELFPAIEYASCR